MKLIIFAGGIGTRLWPLSRENSPKQFDQIFNGKSTIQLAVERVASEFGIENIFIQTVEKYKEIIQDQINELPVNNILIEPARRDLGPAVCFSIKQMKDRGYNGAIAILWADHLMDRVDEFISALAAGRELIAEQPDRFIFLAERPRFANNNLGWIKVNSKIGQLNNRDYYSFAGWKYRPESADCDRMYKSGEHFWNPGYFITSINFLDEQYRNLAPEIHDLVNSNRYEEAEKINFDQAIIEKVDLSNAVVLKTNMGWSDPGTLYALKEALEDSSEKNVIHGQVVELDTKDSLLYNLEENKILAAVGLNGVVVVNMNDALIIAPKEEVVHITKLVKKIKEEGMEEYL